MKDATAVEHTQDHISSPILIGLVLILLVGCDAVMTVRQLNSPVEPEGAAPRRFPRFR